MDNNPQINALGTEPVPKLLLHYAIPATVAMAASSIYNIIDGIFIGQGVGADALNGLGVTMPLMVLTAAVGMLVGAGAATLMSVKLGQKDYEVANKILGNVLVFNLIFGAIVTVILLAFLDPLLLFFGASQVTLPYARDFMVVILAFNITSHTYFGLNALLRSLGKPRIAMFFTICTVLINTALAPIFIYIFDWGISGAAFATVLAQIIMLAFQLRLFNNPNELVYLQKGIFKIDRKIILESLGIGLSPFLINVCACFVVIIINRSLVYYGGDEAVGAYGIGNRLLFLVLTLVLGLNQGMQPIAGYNFGAQKMDRLVGVLRHTLLVATVITTAGFVCFHLFPTALVSAFTTDDKLIKISAHALSSMSWAYPVIGMQIVATTFFQCIGYVKQSIFLSLTRQLIFLVPLLLLLPQTGLGIDGIWYAMPLADTLSFVVTMSLLVYHVRKFRQINPSPLS